MSIYHKALPIILSFNNGNAPFFPMLGRHFKHEQIVVHNGQKKSTMWNEMFLTLESLNIRNRI